MNQIKQSTAAMVVGYYSAKYLHIHKHGQIELSKFMNKKH